MCKVLAWGDQVRLKCGTYKEIKALFCHNFNLSLIGKCQTSSASSCYSESSSASLAGSFSPFRNKISNKAAAAEVLSGRINISSGLLKILSPSWFLCFFIWYFLILLFFPLCTLNIKNRLCFPVLLFSFLFCWNWSIVFLAKAEWGRTTDPGQSKWSWPSAVIERSWRCVCISIIPFAITFSWLQKPLLLWMFFRMFSVSTYSLLVSPVLGALEIPCTGCQTGAVPKDIQAVLSHEHPSHPKSFPRQTF